MIKVLFLWLFMWGYFPVASAADDGRLNRLRELIESVKNSPLEIKIERSVRLPKTAVEWRLYELLKERWTWCLSSRAINSYGFSAANFNPETDSYSFVIPVGINSIASQHADKTFLFVGDDIGIFYIVALTGYAQKSKVFGPIFSAHRC